MTWPTCLSTATKAASSAFTVTSQILAIPRQVLPTDNARLFRVHHRAIKAPSSAPIFREREVRHPKTRARSQRQSDRKPHTAKTAPRRENDGPVNFLPILRACVQLCKAAAVAFRRSGRAFAGRSPHVPSQVQPRSARRCRSARGADKTACASSGVVA